ncbi:MAG: hypothetical protein HOV97_41800 [Nonomuraea sp.]|nr:hypothetical protein [Nonomuraea sp.]
MGPHVDGWHNVPRRIAATGRQVKAGWFRTIDPHVVSFQFMNLAGATTLSRAGGS